MTMNERDRYVRIGRALRDEQGICGEISEDGRQMCVLLFPHDEDCGFDDEILAQQVIDRKQTKIAQEFDVIGPARGHRVQEAIAMVADLPFVDLYDLAIFIRGEAKILEALGRPQWADTARAVAVLLFVLVEDRR